MSFEGVSRRLNELQETNRQLKDLIERLSTLKFQPGSIPLKSEEDDSVMGELKSEIRQIIREQFDDFALLKEDVIDLSRVRHSEIQAQKDGLEQAVQRGENELKAHQIEYRKAVLTARDSLNAAKRAEYLLLVNSAFDPKPRSDTSSPAPGQRRRDKRATQLTQEEKEVHASSDVTLALRRTHDMMASELSRSQFAHETLQESTAALAQLGETYSIMDTMLSSSKNLLGTLLRSQKSDTWYLETAFYILCATIAWLLFRRFLYAPLWWFLWLPLRIFFRSLIGVLTGIGLIGDGGTAVGVSSVASSIAGSPTVVHKSATRASRPSIPPRASVNVGGGGRGGPVQPRETTEGQETVSEHVGRIIDDSQSREGTEQEASHDPVEESPEMGEEAEVQRNPKKRMWEEVKEAAKQDQRVKDEL
ncbi:hypothetical protein D0Z07_2729 [Hyphodiscus hymeniophilus]|uniref:Sec20 C-terminal domain-containing protein n=1 Tax=Hyphodiscus hymeniophilus TaxID=353542 RepID=A0A9P7AYH6_9HELO|nr:hypothetical protein D0Z07_2729 [Hyphodiscus hymeniophilus]